MSAPSVKEEDRRQLHRKFGALKKDRTRRINHSKGLLAGQGVRMPVKKDFLDRLDHDRIWDGSRMPELLRGRLKREFELNCPCHGPFTNLKELTTL